MRIGLKILTIMRKTSKPEVQFSTRDIMEILNMSDSSGEDRYSFDSVYQACRRLHRDKMILKSHPSKSGEEVVWTLKPDGMVDTARVEKKWGGPDVNIATGIELNVIGMSLGVERGNEEPDESYQERIKSAMADV